jgi:hypothetical protein
MTKMTKLQRTAFVDGMLAARELVMEFDKPHWSVVKVGLIKFIGLVAEEVLSGQDFSVVLAKRIEQNEKNQMFLKELAKIPAVPQQVKMPWWNFWSAAL